MRAKLLATLIGLTGPFLSNGAVAQQISAGASASRTAEITVRGCVMGTNRYTLMQPSTGAVFALRGDTERFSQVQGKLHRDYGYRICTTGKIERIADAAGQKLSRDCRQVSGSGATGGRDGEFTTD